MKRFVSIIAISIFALVAISFTNESGIYQRGEWQRLGSRKVNYGLDRDVIRVTATEGGFTKMKILVTGGSLNMHRLVVQYGNGAKDEIPLKHHFQRGSDSRVIDLRGGKRIIRDVTVWYDANNRSRKRATIHIFAKH